MSRLLFGFDKCNFGWFFIFWYLCPVFLNFQFELGDMTSVYHVQIGLFVMDFVMVVLNFVRVEVVSPAMGISGSIRQCCRKCCPMLVLRRQKKCSRKGFHICGLSFQVFTVLLIISERFNLVYN